MPFFLVLPLWVLAVVLGAAMVCFGATRRLGVYVVTVSTFATIASFAISTAVLMAGASAGTDVPAWFGLAIVGGYLGAIPIGGLAGAIVGVLVTRRVLSRASI